MNLNALSDAIIFAGSGSADPMFSIAFAGSLKNSKGNIFVFPDNTYTFGFLDSGNAVINASGTSFLLNSNEMFFIDTELSSSSRIEFTSDTDGFYISCTGKLASTLMSLYAIPSVSVREANIKSFASQLRSILEKTDNTNYSSYMKSASVIFFGIMLEFAYANVSSSKAKNPKDTEAERIKTYIDNMIYNDPSLDDIKDYFGITKMHAIRSFKNHYNITPMQYAIQKRTDIAANLLRTTELPIKTISDMLHYSNTQHFSNSFKKMTGYSPNKYRTLKI